MMKPIVIIGGGLAGLALSIDLRKRGYGVVVIEKGNYPRHKVCGEYLSMESHRYLYFICPDLAECNLPQIDSFIFTSTGDMNFKTKLEPGGFGISRYLLEHMLYLQAREKGVEFILNSKAIDVQLHKPGEDYLVKTNSDNVIAGLVCNSSGRRSNMETKVISKKLATNYVGVKYHVLYDRDPKTIEIHNFPGGYCGISNVENNISCLCYLVNSRMIKKAGNSINTLEKIFLSENSNLKRIFERATFLFKDPVTVSGIKFGVKNPVIDHTYFLGDSAGSISPITGNGMSMGLRSASALAGFIDLYLRSSINRQQLNDKYIKFWKDEFSSRVRFSKVLQRLSESPFLANTAIGVINRFPSIGNRLIHYTHGTTF